MISEERGEEQWTVKCVTLLPVSYPPTLLHLLCALSTINSTTLKYPLICVLYFNVFFENIHVLQNHLGVPASFTAVTPCYATEGGAPHPAKAITRLQLSSNLRHLIIVDVHVIG